MTFGEDEDVVAVVDGFAGVLKAAPEATVLGEWEDVEESGDEPVGEGRKKVEQRAALVAAFAVIEEHFCCHGDGDAVTNVEGECVEDERRVIGGQMVAN